MFMDLLESRPKRTAGHSRRLMSGTVSVTAHASLIALAALATQRSDGPPELPPVEMVSVRMDVTPQHVRPAPAAASSAPSVVTVPVSLPRLPAMPALPSIPVDLPEVTLSPASSSGPIAPRSAGSDEGMRSVLGGAPGGEGTGGGPIWAGAELSMRLAVKPTPPRYPESLRRVGLEGRVVVRFVVDTTGRIDPATVEITESTHELFTAAVRTTLPSLRFHPAEIGDRRLRAQAMMPFVFEIK
jgi:protein TonB